MVVQINTDYVPDQMKTDARYASLLKHAEDYVSGLSFDRAAQLHLAVHEASHQVYHPDPGRFYGPYLRYQKEKDWFSFNTGAVEALNEVSKNEMPLIQLAKFHCAPAVCVPFLIQGAEDYPWQGSVDQFLFEKDLNWRMVTSWQDFQSMGCLENRVPLDGLTTLQWYSEMAQPGREKLILEAAESVRQDLRSPAFRRRILQLAYQFLEEVFPTG